MAADVPLLSSYKRPFVGRRLFHTFTGIKVLRGKPPAYVYAVQVREIQKRDYRNKARLKRNQAMPTMRLKILWFNYLNRLVEYFLISYQQ